MGTGDKVVSDLESKGDSSGVDEIRSRRGKQQFDKQNAQNLINSAYSELGRKTLAGAELLRPPATWKDMKIADDIMRRAVGLDEKSVKIAGLFQNSELTGIGIEIGNKFLDTDENCAE